MRYLATAVALLLTAAVAAAGPITDVRQGLYPVGSWVAVPAGLVTAVTGTGAAIAEAPFGARNALWVELGPGHGLAPGTVLDAYGVYQEVGGLSVLDVAGHLLDGPPGPARFAAVGSATVPPPTALTAAALASNPEPWESCLVHVTDALLVAALHTDGEWSVESYRDGTPLRLDDWWYDATSVQLGDCYQNATGILTCANGVFKLEPRTNGLPFCGPVGDLDATFGGLKALYR